MNRFNIECRAAIEGNTLTGHASVFNQVADMGKFLEAVAYGAFKDALKDVRALWNHDPRYLLGRQSAGTLRMQEDSQGLAFEVDLPDTSYADDLKALVSRGDLTGASFSFIPGRQEFSRSKDGRGLRTHVQFREVIDVSPVTFPAYENAGVQMRSMDSLELLDQRTQLIRARAPKELRI